MKRRVPRVVAVLVLFVAATMAQAATRYFDVNDDATGSGIPNTSAQAWNTITANWNPNADGSGAGPGTTVPWSNGDDAVFSAGSDSNSIRYLLDTQNDDGTWDEAEFTGTGFPRVFYLRYHLYRVYFPLMALSRYKAAVRLPAASTPPLATRIPALPLARHV